MPHALPNKWAYVGLIVLLAWVPLPLGSNRTIAHAPILLMSTAVMLTALASWLPQASALVERLSRYKWPLLLLGCFVLLQWCTLIPLPEAWVARVSPETHFLVTKARLLAAPELLGAAMPLSLEPYQSGLFAGLSTAYLCCFVTALLTVHGPERLERLVFCIVCLGLVQATLGIALYSAGAQYSVMFFDLVHDRTLGSFSYVNHYAAYLNICLSTGIGLMLARLGRPQGAARNWQQRARRILTFMLSNKMRLRLMLVVLVIALVLTRSRMGNAAFFGSLLGTGLLALVLMRRTAPAIAALVLSLLVVDVVVVGSWVGLEKVVDRIQGTALTADGGGTQESVEARADAAKQAIPLLETFPWFGTGAGTFYAAFLPYNKRPHLFVDHAHNDYMELATDNGLVGLGLLGAFVIATFVAMVLTMARRRSALPRGIAFGTTMAMGCLALHSLTDSGLQLPANALTLVVLMGCGWVAWALPSGRDEARATGRDASED